MTSTSCLKKAVLWLTALTSQSHTDGLKKLKPAQFCSWNFRKFETPETIKSHHFCQVCIHLYLTSYKSVTMCQWKQNDPSTNRQWSAASLLQSSTVSSFLQAVLGIPSLACNICSTCIHTHWRACSRYMTSHDVTWNYVTWALQNHDSKQEAKPGRLQPVPQQCMWSIAFNTKRETGHAKCYICQLSPDLKRHRLASHKVWSHCTPKNEPQVNLKVRWYKTSG